MKFVQRLLSVQAPVARALTSTGAAFRPLSRILMGISLGLASLAAPALAQAQQANAPQLDLRRTDLTAGMYRIDTQLAITPQQREIGLMFRKEMPQQEGMLFIFETPGVQCFWMRNTILPLSAAFVADDGTIVNLADMKPQTDDSHCSAKPVRFVLEMNQGWFAKRGIKAGAKLTGTPFATQ